MNEIVKEFPSNLDILGIKHENEVEKKLALPVYDKLSESAKYLINQLNSFEFVNFLNKITGIKEPLFPDPYLEGGGYHELKENGFLNIHSDFNFHLKTKLDRRVNVLIYLNKDWEENFGGSLELWDKEMKKCEKKNYT
jgi:Rps23 Pro-64 3,4-dihydroxylase Tpa1-like proline 4-hydroxylase